MIIPRAAVKAVLVACSTASLSCSAWTTTTQTPKLITTATSRFVGRSIAPATIARRNLQPGRRSLSTTTTTSLSMGVLDNLFGGILNDGGAYGMKIDYTKLDFPGNELGEIAEEKGSEVPPTHSKKYPHLQMATFAGGCFWGLELAYQRVPGVEYTAVGYTQGIETYPNYDQVCSGNTGHTEAVMVYYDPSKCTYEQLLDTYFGRVNPTTVNGQGNDYGRQYRTGVYYHTPQQEKVARQRFEKEQQTYYSNKPIASELESATTFWPAEKYHQHYLEKGGRSGQRQDASKGATETIRCYG